MGGGGGSDKPKFPSEIRQMWGIGHPMAQQMSLAAQEGIPLWNVPSMPTVPGPVMPSEQWYQGIAPEVKAGLWAPYKEAGQQLMETLGGSGQIGSARGGYSGAAGAALGQLAAKGSEQVGLQAWNMTAPQMMDYRNQLYQSALQQRGDVMQAQQAPWTLFPSYLGGMGQLPMYQQQNYMNPYVAAGAGALGGYAMGGGWPGAAAGGIYSYYANQG